MRLGFIGCGKIAQHHAAAFAHLGALIVAGCGQTEDSARWLEFRAKTGAAYRKPEQILDSSDIDGIVVCLPPAQTAIWLRSILASQKAALIEKPISPAGMNLAGANKLVGYNRRYYGTVARLRDRLMAGGLIAVHATLPGDVYASAIHGLDLLFHLLGPLKWKYARRNGLAESGEGVPVSIAMNQDDPVNSSIRMLFGDATSWLLLPFETLCVYRGFDVSGTTIRRYAPRLVEKAEEPATFKPGFLDQSRAFLSREFGPGARPAESVALMEFVDEVC